MQTSIIILIGALLLFFKNSVLDYKHVTVVNDASKVQYVMLQIVASLTIVTDGMS